MNVLDIVNKALDAEVAAQVATATATLQSKVTTQATEITALKSTVTARNATITTLETENAALKAEIQRLKDGTPVPPDEPPVIVIPPTGKRGVIISIPEMLEIPMEDVHVGYAKERADAELEPTVLNDNDTQTDVNGTANAICAVLFPDKRDYYFERAVWQLAGLPNAPTSRILEGARSFQAHAQTANILKHLRPEWDDSGFRRFGMAFMAKNLPGSHSGYNYIPLAAKQLLNNHSNMCLSALAGFALHCMEWGTDAEKKQAKEWLDMAVIRHRVFLGDLPRADAGWFIKVDPTGWLPEGANGGINPRGSTVRGQRPDGTPETIYVSGMEPMEYLRPAREIAIYPVPEGDSEYISEAKNAYVPAATMLHRAGLVDFNAGDDAIQRAFDAIYWRGEVTQNWTRWERPLKKDDVWELDYVNYFAKFLKGKSDFYPTPDHDATPGKGTGFGGLFWRWRYKGITKAEANHAN
jgi:hypothetical protein